MPTKPQTKTAETVKGGAGSTLTFEKGNWQRVFNAESVKGWDVSGFDKIDINVINPTVKGTGKGHTDKDYGLQGGVDVFHAWNGGAVKVHDVGTLNVNVEGLSSEYGQDPVVLHARGGTIDINTKDAISVNLNGAGNVIMSQNSETADGSVSLTSAKSISLYSKSGNLIVLGAIVDSKENRTATVSLKAPVIDLKTDGTDKAVINPYNTKWLSAENAVGQPGSSNIAIEADEVTLSAPKGFGIWTTQRGVETGKTVAGTLSIKSTVKTTINSLKSAVHVDTANGTNAVTIASPVTELVSTDASQTTVEGTAGTTVNFTGVNNGTTQVSVTSAGTNAVDVAGTLSATNAAVDRTSPPQTSAFMRESRRSPK